MKKIIGISLATIIATMSGIYASPEKGKALMKDTGCTMCHKATVDQLSNGMGSSIATIKERYGKDGKSKLASFLKGDSKPMIAPESFATMKSWVFKTKKMTDDERADIADFILADTESKETK